MAGKAVTQDEIRKMNTLFLELKTYAAVARQVGRSSSTVKKYIIPGFVPQGELEINEFTGDIPDVPDWSEFRNKLGALCEIFPDEWQDYEILRSEISM